MIGAEKEHQRTHTHTHTSLAIDAIEETHFFSEPIQSKPCRFRYTPEDYQRRSLCVQIDTLRCCENPTIKRLDLQLLFTVVHVLSNKQSLKISLAFLSTVYHQLRSSASKALLPHFIPA